MTIRFSLQMHRFVAIFLIDVIFIVYLKVEAEKTPLFYDISHGQALYADYIKKYNKVFASREEYRTRYLNFLKTLKQVNEINARPVPLKVVPNKFADLSEADKMEALETTTKVDADLRLAMADNAPKVLDLFKIM